MFKRFLSWLTRPEEVRPEEIGRKIFLLSEML